MTRHEKAERVVVVGCGLVGALWSLFLARKGHQVDVYERGPDPREQPARPGRSTHLVISERGWNAISAVGAETAIRKISIPLSGRSIHSIEGGLVFHPYGEPGQAIYAVDRAALNRTLSALAASHENVRVFFGRRCRDIDLDRAVLEVEDTASAQRSEVVPDRIFAADGAFSTIRFAMLRKGRFEYSQSYLPYAHKELSMSGAASRLEPNSAHVWPRRRLLMIAFPNPGGTFTATLVMPLEGDPSFSSIRTVDELRRFFDDNFPDAVRLMPNLEDEFFRHPAISPVTTRCAPWFYGERIVLLGDAAHAMVPFLGQGMNCSFEDCFVLDRLMTDHEHDWPTILREYQEARLPNTDAVTEMSAQHFKELAERIDSPGFSVRKSIEDKIHRAYPDRFLSLYSRIAFTQTPYARAREIARLQEALVDELMAHPRVVEDRDSPEVRRLVDALVTRLPRT